MKSRYQKSLSTLALGLFLATGTYNAVVINSESQLNSADIKFVKRLDELYGVHEPGRLVAASVSWQKLTPQQVAQIKAPAPKIIQTVTRTDSAPAKSDGPAAAAVQEDLNLNLVEVINPKKWQQGLPNNQFNGNLVTSNGTIESLSVSLPNGEGVSVSFSEMAGNVFEYDLDGEVYSGMMYQVDQNSYMITLTNGPLEGTRMKFLGEPSFEQAQAQEYLAQENVQPGNFGESNPPTIQAQETQNTEAEPYREQYADQYQQPVIGDYNPQYNAQEAANADLQLQQQGLQAQNFNPEQQQVQQ